MSKLYTKEMFLIAAEKCEVSMIDAQHIMQYIDEYVTPIQLPTMQKEQIKMIIEHYHNRMFYLELTEIELENITEMIYKEIFGGQDNE